MISPLSTGIIKSNKILENSSLQKILFQYPKEKIDLFNHLNFSVPYIQTKTNSSSISFSSSNNNSSIKVKNNYSFNNKYIKTDNKTVNEQKKGNLFLGKKSKIFFNVNKNCKKKQFFITNKIEEKLINIPQDNKTILNIEDSNLPGNASPDKSAELIRQLEKALPQKEKPKLFNIINYNLFETFNV